MIGKLLAVSLLMLPTGAESNSTAKRLHRIDLSQPPGYIKGDCESLKELFRWHGMTDEESSFFFGQGILKRESGCGRDTYNENTGDTGVCQLTHWHSKPGYFFGKYYSRGWAVELFNLYVGSAHQGIDRDDPNNIPACLWLLRGGTLVPGKLNTDPWNL